MTKNRFDGDLGKVPLTWDKESCTMSGHFNCPPLESHTPFKQPPQSVARDVSWPTRNIGPTVTYTPSASTKPLTSTQGSSKLIGRIPSAPVKGSPLVNQANRLPRGQSNTVA